MSADARDMILVIDDNLQNREVAEGHLVSAGYDAVKGFLRRLRRSRS